MGRAVGVDLGSESLRGLVLEEVKGRLEVVSAGAAPLGGLAALDDTEDKRLAIGEKLKELVVGARLKAPLRRVAAFGKHFSLRYLTVPPVPPWRLEMLARYEVEEHSEEREPTAYDYRILDVPDVAGQYTVLLGCYPERQAQWVFDTCRQAGLGEVEIDLKALALYNAYYHGHGYAPDKTVLVVDIGAENATVLVVRHGALYLARSFEGGGRRFTQVLADELRINPLEAEELKKTEAEIIFDVAPGGARRTTRFPRMATTVRRSAGAGPAEGEEPGAGAAGAGATPQAGQGAAAAGAPGSDAESQPKVFVRPAPSSPPAAPPAELELSPLAPPLGEPEAPRSAPPVPPPLPPEKPAEQSADAPESTADRRRRQVSQALVREAAGLCAALENAANYCRQQYKMPDLKVDTVYLAGGGSRLKGLPQLISRRLRAPVEVLQTFQRLKLDRLPPEAAQTLRREQDTMAVAAGMAIGGLCKGAFSFLLWPAALKERQQFWARKAYLYYAAALVLGALSILWLTPWRNARVLAENQLLAQAAVASASEAQSALDRKIEEHEELLHRLEQIDLNARSGEFFLKVLAALKDPKRIPSNVWLTSLSTSLPAVVMEEVEPGKSEESLRPPGAAPARSPGLPTETFQSQAKVYLRGFVRSGQNEDLYGLIKGDRTKTPFVPGFSDLLVPFPDSPDHVENVFKDIRPVWAEMEDHDKGPLFLKEFVLEAFVEGTREVRKARPAAAVMAEKPPASKAPASTRKAGPAKLQPAKQVPKRVAPARPVQPVTPPMQPAPARPVQPVTPPVQPAPPAKPLPETPGGVEAF